MPKSKKTKENARYIAKKAVFAFVDACLRPVVVY
jgi:hypothetical protein